jgi:hypothetical protein
MLCYHEAAVSAIETLLSLCLARTENNGKQAAELHQQIDNHQHIHQLAASFSQTNEMITSS